MSYHCVFSVIDFKFGPMIAFALNISILESLKYRCPKSGSIGSWSEHRNSIVKYQKTGLGKFHNRTKT